MTTVELLAYCKAHAHQPCVPDLVWQHGMHRDENIGLLLDGSLSPHGFHDMVESILEPRSWLLRVERTYATVLFTEGLTDDHS